MTPEGKIQKRITTGAKSAGALVRKLKWEGRNGAPDLIIMLNGYVIFVEVKKPGGKPKPHQVAEHERMARHGMDVRIIDNIGDADLLVAELVALA